PPPPKTITLSLHDALPIYLDNTFAFDSLHSVANEVLDHLTQQAFVKPDLRCRSHEFRLNPHLRRSFEIFDEFPDNAVRISTLQLRLWESRKLEILADDIV